MCGEIILGFILLNQTFCNHFSMCIHTINVKNDLLDRPYVQLIYITNNKYQVVEELHKSDSMVWMKYTIDAAE